MTSELKEILDHCCESPDFNNKLCSVFKIMKMYIINLL